MYRAGCLRKTIAVYALKVGRGIQNVNNMSGWELLPHTMRGMPEKLHCDPLNRAVSPESTGVAWSLALQNPRQALTKHFRTLKLLQSQG